MKIKNLIANYIFTLFQKLVFSILHKNLLAVFVAILFAIPISTPVMADLKNPTIKKVVAKNEKKIKTEKVIGQIIKPKKELNLPFKYYLTIQRSDGKVHAYPFKSEKVNPKMMKEGQFYSLDVYTTTEKHTLGEKTQDLHIMHVTKAKYMTMKELGMAPPHEDDINAKNPVFEQKGKSYKRGPDFRMNDKVTNSLIFAAGATLLYSILAN